MTNFISEDEIEHLTLDILRDDLGYSALFGPNIAEGDSLERTYQEVVLVRRLQEAIDRVNPAIPAEAKEEALKKVLRTASPDLLPNNEAFHVLLTDGVDVKFRTATGTRSDKVWLVDFTRPENNDFLAVNQYTVIEGQQNKRADVVLFINGLPLVVIELKRERYSCNMAIYNPRLLKIG